MRIFARRAVRATMTLAAAVLLSLTGVGVAHADLPPNELRQVTDEYLFDYTLSGFMSVRAQQPYDGQLDWSSDSCSWSPNEPVGYDFDPSCKRHDFGYRNYKLQGRFTEATRLQIDNNFREDMYNTCDGDAACETIADIYYEAVRQFGSLSTSTAEALERANVDEKVHAVLTE